MNKFMSYEDGNGVISAMSAEEWRSTKHLSDNGIIGLQEWVWQWAKDKATAIRQHEAKHDEWRNDLDAGKMTEKVY